LRFIILILYVVLSTKKDKMIQFSDRLIHMEESATLAMSRLSRELKAQGKDIISLSLGEPDFPTPQFIKDAAIEAMDNNYTSYTPVSGYDDLREAIAQKFYSDNNLRYSKTQIVVSTGAKQAIANVVLSLIGPGDEVIIPAPYWVSYIEIVKLAQGIPVIIQTDINADFKINAEQLQQAISKKTKLMIFSSPCNPTGTVYEKDELKSLAEVIAQHPHIAVISDEIYEHIRFVGKHESLAQFDEIYQQVITVNGVSKAWSMTGWRIGYIGAPQKIADACTKIQGQFTSGACSIAQKAAIAAVRASPEKTKKMVVEFEKRRDLVFSELQKIDSWHTYKPTGAFYLFPDVSECLKKAKMNIRTANDLCMYLLNEASVALVSGEAFGNPNCVRISYATSQEVLLEATHRIQKAIKKLQ